ncbi:MAG: oligosaccharide flippase family protein, partial [Chloroflexota bacterium]
MNKNFIAQFLKGSISASTGTLLTVGFHFLSITIMTRYISQEMLGLYFLIIATAAFLKIVGNLGLDLTLVKYLTEKEGDEKQEAVTIILIVRFIVLALFSVILYFGSALILPLLGEGLEPYVILIPLIFIGHSLREFFLFMLQGLQRFAHYAMIQAVSSVIKFGLIYFYRNELTVNMLLYIELVMLAVSILIQLWIINFRELGLYNLRFSRETFGKVFTFGFPLYYTSLLVAGYGKSSVFLINYYLSPASIALFEIAVKIPEGFVRILRSFLVVYFPNIATLFSQDKKQEALKFINKTVGVGSVGISILCVITFIFGADIVKLVFSPQYENVSLAFSLAMFNIYLASISNILGYSLVSAGHPKSSSIVNTASTVIYLVSSILLIPLFGFVGAIIGFLIMNSAAMLFYFIYMSRVGIRADARQFVLPTSVAVFVCVLFTLVGMDNFVVKIGFIGML